MLIIGYSKRLFKNDKGDLVVYYRVSTLEPVSSKNPDASGYDASYFTLGESKFSNLRKSIDDAIVGGCQVNLLYNRYGKVESVSF